MDKEKKKKSENEVDEETKTPPETEPKDESADDKADKAEENNDSAEKKDEKSKSDEAETSDEEKCAESSDDKADDTSPKAEAPTPDNDLKTENLILKAQLSAHNSGIRKDVVEDAVILAVYDAKKSGEVTEDSIKTALSDVINRHPEWKDFYNGEKPNFRVGADGMQQAQSSTDEIAQIFGNK